MYSTNWITETARIEHDGAYFIVELRKSRHDDNAKWELKSLRTIGEYENKYGADISVWLSKNASDAFCQIVRKAIVEVEGI